MAVRKTSLFGTFSERLVSQIEWEKELAGHVSRKMLEHYSHSRIAAKRHALECLGKLSHDTLATQNELRFESEDAQVVEKNGGQCRARTCDLLLVRQAL